MTTNAMPGTRIPAQANQVPQDGQNDLWVIGDPVVQDTAYPVDEASPMSEVHHTLPVPEDVAEIRYTTGSKRFAGDPGKAVPVFQRAATDANFGSVWVTSTGAGTAIIQGRQKGRVSVTLSVPTTFTNPGGGTITPTGVCVSSQEGEVQTFGSNFQLNPGDSITVCTESPIYVGLLPGASTGVVQWFIEYNPAAGELGNT